MRYPGVGAGTGDSWHDLGGLVESSAVESAGNRPLGPRRVGWVAQGGQLRVQENLRNERRSNYVLSRVNGRRLTCADDIVGKKT